MKTGAWLPALPVAQACNEAVESIKRSRAAQREREIAAAMAEKRWFGPKWTRAQAEAFVDDDPATGIRYMGQQERLQTLYALSKAALLTERAEVYVTAESYADFEGCYRVSLHG